LPGARDGVREGSGVERVEQGRRVGDRRELVTDPVQQRGLAEVVAGTVASAAASAAGDVDLAGDDHVEVVRVVTVRDDDRARREGEPDQHVGEGFQPRFRQRAEQLERAEHGQASLPAVVLMNHGCIVRHAANAPLRRG
jgi:hypothetical protein